MDKNDYKVLCTELIAMAQRYDILSTDTQELADELQDMAANERYIKTGFNSFFGGMSNERYEN